MKQSFDLIIVGGGSAAFAAALKAEENELRTLIVNGGLPIGGTCVNVGCLPSKFLIRAAESIHRASASPFGGITTNPPQWNYSKIIREKRSIVETMRAQKYEAPLNNFEHVSVREGFAKFGDAHTIEIDGDSFEADHLIIATGSTTSIPPIEGLASAGYLTNDSLFELEVLPETLTILGGGYIGLEIAQAYRRFGSKVRIIEALDRILAAEMQDISDEINRHLIEEGVEIHAGVTVLQVMKRGDSIFISGSKGKDAASWETSHLVVATGRKPNTTGIGLENIGIDMSRKGNILVSDTMQTSVSHIYAIGDCTDKPPFVYSAAYGGGIAVDVITGKKRIADFTALPWVIFTDPQVVGVGIDEQEALRKGIPFEVSSLSLSEVPRSITAMNTKGFVKLIRNPETDQLLGARIVASEASELLMELSLAMKYNITISELAATMHPYLTLSESIKLAAIAFSKDVHALSCCAS